MPGPASDALRDALAGLASALDGIIDSLQPGDPVRVRLEQAQTDIENAAANVAAQTIENALTNNADLAKLTQLSGEINARADAIAASVANVNRISGIASKALGLANALSGGSIGGILTAVSDLQGAIS